MEAGQLRPAAGPAGRRRPGLGLLRGAGLARAGAARAARAGGGAPRHRGGDQGRRGARARAGGRQGREQARPGRRQLRPRAGEGRPADPLIALVYDGELLDRVPAERHDVPVRAAVTR